MTDFTNDESALGFINHTTTMPVAQQALKTFGDFAAGKAVDYGKASRQLQNACQKLEALRQQDEELLSDMSASMEMTAQFKAAFEALLNLLNGGTDALGKEGELLKSVLTSFTRAIEAFAGSELDPLATDAFTAQAYEGHTLTEPSQEERLLREFLAQLTLLCRSTLLLNQCRNALAVVQALLQNEPDHETVRQAGANYIFELARLRTLIMLEPMLTVMVGREQFRN